MGELPPARHDFPAAEPDEVLYFDGRWYLIKPRPFPLPEFDFMGALEAQERDMARIRSWNDWQWSMRIAPPPGPICLVTGVS
jgi:hypothetical protein